MSDLGLALAAGLLAAVNPCGFALLPVYLTVLVLGDDAPSRPVAVRRAVAATAAMTAGFVAVFGVFGLLLTPALSAAHAVLPWFTAGFGLLVAVAGGWLLAGRSLPGLTALRVRGPVVRRTPLSMLLFGMAYAASSLSCTIAPFLAIVASSLRAGTPGAGVALFVAYAAGMGLLVGAAALAVAVSRPRMVTGMRRFGPALSRLVGVVVLLAGAYVAYYGIAELRGDVEDPVLDAAQTVQRSLAGAVDRLGAAGFVVVSGALLAGALLTMPARNALRRRRRPRRHPVSGSSGSTAARPRRPSPGG
ncbi:cytochrome c biogenesis protein CcdA [Dactylosporangium aurantiacum]|uniref:Cytochrome c biogenesis protein CcdA n=1 Tax=Dactylosporangium aurantiacum TaxID=35754 RepID=A0A9Q9ICZ4_9ACTN|nr:cytochrome c biogenesis protein CcdA [Dactylosporangium aurantiacum]MDG6107337.1 cytochrome c biogenesis protein CcdA [Dactylosporangium aurantiacum]UWZ51139.1 cytochrome c biogenesis protein CcdA [Dactylosporangium aurantiacum]